MLNIINPYFMITEPPTFDMLSLPLYNYIYSSKNIAFSGICREVYTNVVDIVSENSNFIHI